jgi:hypothetical protein
LHMRPRVQRASGLPCALSVFRRDNEMQNSGRIAPRDRERVCGCLKRESKGFQLSFRR